MKIPKLSNLFFPKREDEDFSFKRYLRDLKAGEFRDWWNLGVLDQKIWLRKQMHLEPNAVYIGAMGSGKSAGANFTLVTWMLANADQTVLFIADTLKGANDFKTLFEYPQVYPILSSEQGIHRMIDLVIDEIYARRDKFNEVQAENIIEYEKKIRKETGNNNYKMARVVMFIDEFHAIPYNILNFDKDYKTPNTSAHKFHQIMRVGRSMGVWVIACSQKGTKSDIPPEIIPNFTQKQVFRVNRNEASYFLSDTKAAEIRTDQKGRCETDFGTVQFPYLPVATQIKLLKKYMKPLDAECAYLDPKLITDYLGGRSTEELYRLKKLPDLIEGIESYDHELIVEIIHKKLDHKVTRVDSKIDPNGIAMVIDWPGKGRIAVMIRVGTKKITGKHIHKLSKGMQLMQCDRGILYTSAEDLPAAVYKNAIENKIEIVDHEDMLRLAHQIEAKTAALKDLDPSKLADEGKESGEYQKTHPQNEAQETEDLSVYDTGDDKPSSSYIKPVAQDPKDAEEEDSLAKRALQELLDSSPKTPDLSQEAKDQVESEEKEIDTEDAMEALDDAEKSPVTEKPATQKSIRKEVADIAENTLISPLTGGIKPVKRVPVRGSFFLKSDDSPEILLQTQKNSSGEIYRVLMYVILNKNTHHKFYLDRQVAGEFDIKDRARLNILNTKEWNEQKDDVNNRQVLEPGAFEKEMLAYLENFKQYELGMVKAICWSEDADFFRPILAKCRHMDPNPTIFEEMASVYGVDGSRDMLIAQNKLSIKRQDIWTPIEIDLQIWRYLSP